MLYGRYVAADMNTSYHYIWRWLYEASVPPVSGDASQPLWQAIMVYVGMGH